MLVRSSVIDVPHFATQNLLSSLFEIERKVLARMCALVPHERFSAEQQQLCAHAAIELFYDLHFTMGFDLIDAKTPQDLTDDERAWLIDKIANSYNAALRNFYQFWVAKYVPRETVGYREMEEACANHSWDALTLCAAVDPTLRLLGVGQTVSPLSQESSLISVRSSDSDYSLQPYPNYGFYNSYWNWRGFDAGVSGSPGNPELMWLSPDYFDGYVEGREVRFFGQLIQAVRPKVTQAVIKGATDLGQTVLDVGQKVQVQMPRLETDLRVAGTEMKQDLASADSRFKRYALVIQHEFEHLHEQAKNLHLGDKLKRLGAGVKHLGGEVKHAMPSVGSVESKGAEVARGCGEGMSKCGEGISKAGSGCLEFFASLCKNCGRSSCDCSLQDARSESDDAVKKIGGALVAGFAAIGKAVDSATGLGGGGGSGSGGNSSAVLHSEKERATPTMLASAGSSGLLHSTVWSALTWTAAAGFSVIMLPNNALKAYRSGRFVYQGLLTEPEISRLGLRQNAWQLGTQIVAGGGTFAAIFAVPVVGSFPLATIGALGASYETWVFLDKRFRKQNRQAFNEEAPDERRLPFKALRTLETKQTPEGRRLDPLKIQTHLVQFLDQEIYEEHVRAKEAKQESCWDRTRALMHRFWHTPVKPTTRLTHLEAARDALRLLGVGDQTKKDAKWQEFLVAAHAANLNTDQILRSIGVDESPLQSGSMFAIAPPMGTATVKAPADSSQLTLSMTA